MEQQSIEQGVDLEKRERALEQRALGLGAARYVERMLRAEDQTAPGRALIQRMVVPLAPAIQQWIDTAQCGAAARQAGLAHFLSQFDPVDVAFIVARHLLHAFTEKAKLTRTALALTRHLEEVSMSAALRQQDEKAWKRLQTKIKRNPYPNRRYVMIRKASQPTRVGRISWTIAERTRLGVHLVAMCAEVTGMFIIEERRMSRSKTTLYIALAPETMTWLDTAHNRCQLLAPVFLPMVVPPRPWRGVKGGGYLDTRDLRSSLFNGHSTERAYRDGLKHVAMPMVYAAINAIQATPWRINAAVARVLKEVWESGGSVGGLPPRDLLPLPAKPWGDGPEPDPESDLYKAHRAQVARVHQRNDSNVSKRLSLVAKIEVIDEFSRYERIYFPHVMDWRGRIYPLPSFVNPQSDDNGKALVEFADGVALGAEGARWLAIHGANCYGIDKVPFDERVEWVEQHQDDILDSAVRPLEGSRFWADAEDPYLFLAFCMEWAGLMLWVGSGREQGEFVSHLPVSFDGSCNGLQNFSALLRDEVGGAATNLAPSDTPADIYQKVADVASKRIERDAKNGEVNAVYWLGKMTRKITKRPTMTLPYGSGRYGFREQIALTLEELKLADDKPYLHGDAFLNSMYAANVILDSLGEVVVAARQAMDWLREVSQVMVKQARVIRWTTPAGFVVQQAYRESAGQQISILSCGRQRQVSVRIPTDKLDARKQAQGISPNFIHSLDAAHLMRTVGKCSEAGVTSLMMVHDSYGCHAGHARTLQHALREAFVEQYHGNVLEDFRQQLISQLPPDAAAEVPPCPPLGRLELPLVMQSEYFFA